MSEPLCEVCGKNPANGFSWSHEDGWRYVCGCTDDDPYDFKIENWESNYPHSRKHTWRDQLREKTWFVEKEFDAMLARYYAARSGALISPLKKTKYVPNI